MRQIIVFLVVATLSLFFAIGTSYGEEILGCYQKIHGQLRIVGDHSQCLNSENKITWGDTTTQEPPPPPEPPADNSKYFGIYSIFMKSGKCADFGVIAINGDSEMVSAGFHIYLPLDDNFIAYTVDQYKNKSQSDVEVTIDENKITVVKDVRKTDGDRYWTDTMIFNFNEDQSAYTLTGHMGDDSPPECIGDLTGYGQRLHHIEN